MINLWIALRADIASGLKSAIAGEATTIPAPVVEAAQAQIGGFDLSVTASLFKVAVLDGTPWVAYTIYLPDETVPGWIGAFQALFPSAFRMLGAWNLDGTQVGTQRVIVDEIETIEGTPTYPIDPDLLAWMPDTWDETTETMIPATELAQVVLLAGQAPRHFG